jgi:hypothetical protein
MRGKVWGSLIVLQKEMIPEFLCGKFSTVYYVEEASVSHIPVSFPLLMVR